MSQTELMIIPQSEPQESPYSIALACYILHVATFYAGISGCVGMVGHCLKRATTAGTWLKGLFA